MFQFITHFDSSHARVSVDVIVIDPATGTQVGNTLSLDGFVNGGKFNEDGSRYTLIGYEPPWGGAMGSATLVVLDTETGAHVGDTYTSTFPGLVFQTYFTPRRHSERHLAGNDHRSGRRRSIDHRPACRHRHRNGNRRGHRDARHGRCRAHP